MCLVQSELSIAEEKKLTSSVRKKLIIRMDGKLEKNGEASVLRFHELGRLVLGLRRVDAGCWKFRGKSSVKVAKTGEICIKHVE